MANDTLDPAAEFAEGTTVEPEVKTTPPPEPGASAAEVAELKAQLAALSADHTDKASVLEALRNVLAPQQGKPLDERDKFVRQEILRLAPELGQTAGDLAQIKKLLPMILDTVGATAEERVAERASTATEVMKGLMKGTGLNAEDADTVGYMEEAVVREIKHNPELKKQWESGRIKDAVSKAFDKVSSKILAPARASVKQRAVNAIMDAPKASPKGGAVSAGANGAKLDLTDTSRDNVRKVHDAAFDRIQELLAE